MYYCPSFIPNLYKRNDVPIEGLVSTLCDAPLYQHKKLTGLILEMDIEEVLHFLESPTELMLMVAKTMDVLRGVLHDAARELMPIKDLAYALVNTPTYRHKVTKMILELDTAEVLYLLESPDSLKLAVEEAMNYKGVFGTVNAKNEMVSRKLCLYVFGNHDMNSDVLTAEIDDIKTMDDTNNITTISSPIIELSLTEELEKKVTKPTLDGRKVEEEVASNVDYEPTIPICSVVKRIAISPIDWIWPNILPLNHNRYLLSTLIVTFSSSECVSLLSSLFNHNACVAAVAAMNSDSHDDSAMRGTYPIAFICCSLGSCMKRLTMATNNQIVSILATEGVGGVIGPHKSLYTKSKGETVPRRRMYYCPSFIPKMLGEMLFPLVDQLEHEHAAKVTGLILEMDTTEVLHLLESPTELRLMVAKTMDVLMGVLHDAREPMPIKDLASALVNTPTYRRRMILGENMYPLINKLEHKHGHKVTEMILELDTTEVLYLLESPKELKLVVDEAMDVLSNAFVSALVNAPRHARKKILDFG
nr:polyadenylate-binding protein 2-like [Tanacetum cinerariifolium]